MSQNWYVMAFGVELGPMSWNDLLGRAKRGDVRQDTQVRQGEHGPFVNAGDVPGLFGSPVTETPESSPLSEPPRKEQMADKEPGPVAPSGPSVAHPPTAHPPASVPPTKAAKRAARTGAPRPRVAIRLPGKPFAVLAGTALIASTGYFGWARWPSKSAPLDHQRVATLYRQAYEQIKQFRGKPQKQSPVGLQFQFSRTVGALRRQLEQSSGDSSARPLAEAGTQLTQMLADCQAASGSAEATRFTESEQRFLAILDSFPNGRQ